METKCVGIKLLTRQLYWKSNPDKMLQCRRLASLTSRRRAAVVWGIAGVAVALLVDGNDPEAVGAEGAKVQLQVVEVPGHALALHPPPPRLLCVLLLPFLHDELWEKKTGWR